MKVRRSRVPSFVRGVHLLSCLTLLFGLLVIPIAAPRVASAADGVVGDGTSASCTQAALVEELQAGGAITFACGGAIVIPVTNQISVTTDATLLGGGLVTLDGETSLELAQTTSMLVVSAGITLTLDSIALVNGSSAGNGGTIYNVGTLEFINSRISDSTAGLPGGAIYNASSGTLEVEGALFERNTVVDGQHGGAIATDGVATIVGSVFDTNRAAYGGAIFGSNTVTITDTTLRSNTATANGGGYFGSGQLTVERSTFSGNSSGGDGAGLGVYGSGPHAITNSTFSGNQAAGKAAILAQSTVLTILATTISGNTATTGANALFHQGSVVKVGHSLLAGGSGNNCPSGLITTLGHNLSSDGSCAANAFTASTDLNNVPANIEPLADNGAPTQTHALEDDSAAIDAGDAAICAAAPMGGIDQRGTSRVEDGDGDGTTACDIGAFEYVLPDTTTPDSTHVLGTTPIFEGWFAGSVGVALSASDDSGVEQICYLLNAASTTVCTPGASVELTVATNGVNDLEYWAIDLAENEENPHNRVSLKVDASAPVTIATPDREPINGWYSAPVDIVISATDAESGVAQICFALDADAPQCGVPDSAGETDFTVSESGTLTYWAEDAVGNTGAMGSHDIAIDSDTPVAEATFSPDTAPGSWSNRTVKVVVSGSDTSSPIVEVCVKFTGALQRSLQCASRSSWPMWISRDGQTTLEFFVRDAAGNESATRSHTLLVDRTRPRITNGPEIEIVTGQAPRMRVDLSWEGSDIPTAPLAQSGDGTPLAAVTESGIARYRVQFSTNGGSSWQNIQLPSATATTVPFYVLPGQPYRFRVSVLDVAGNSSSWTVSDLQSFSMVDDNAATYTGGWWTTSSATALGGSFRGNTRVNARATYTVCGDDVAWLASTRPTGGIAAVYIDGATTPVSVDLYSPTTKNRQIVFRQAFNDGGCHMLRIVVTGTNAAPSTGTIVTIDGFIVRNLTSPPPE